MADAPTPLYGNSFWRNWLEHMRGRGYDASTGPLNWGQGNDNPRPAPPVTTGKPTAQLPPDVLQRLMQYTGVA
jgi:3',5'-cyclic AMP phosphodiesterase CpdA